MNEKEKYDISDLGAGQELAGGKYVIEKKIGAGGFGITYKATQRGLNRSVCIKEYFLAGRCVRDGEARTIHVQGTEGEVFEKYRQSFVKEAQTLAALHHPGIVEVIDIFSENNTSYMVMPFIEGRSLQSIVESEGALSYPEAVNYVGQVADAVGYIHERHILHRDIKPDNIMITGEYKAVLIDFGAAREFEEDKTQAHTSMITHGYAPTEQYTRNSRKGAYTDIYAIGATLYYVLTGVVPMEAAARITETMPEPRELNPEIPEEANRTIMKAMRLKSGERHQSIAEFMNDLRNMDGEEKTEESKEEEKKSKNKKEANWASGKRKKKWVWMVVLGAVVIVGLGVWLGVRMASDPVKKEAKEKVGAYRESVQRVGALIDEGSVDRPQSWIKARELMEGTVMPMEDAYGMVMAEVYGEGAKLNGRLHEMIRKAAEEWAGRGFTQLKEYGDFEQAMKCYELSLQLREDAEIRAEYEDVKIQREEVIGGDRRDYDKLGGTRRD